MEKIIGVIGSSSCNERLSCLAEKVGKLVAGKGFVLLTGGYGGIMEAASKGAKSVGGLTLGVLPSKNKTDANRYVDIAIATGIDIARNFIIAATSDGVIAVGGAYGTLSEIAFALQLKKPVIGLESWGIPGVVEVHTPEEALDKLVELLT